MPKLEEMNLEELKHIRKILFTIYGVGFVFDSYTFYITTDKFATVNRNAFPTDLIHQSIITRMKYVITQIFNQYINDISQSGSDSFSS